MELNRSLDSALPSLNKFRPSVMSKNEMLNKGVVESSGGPCQSFGGGGSGVRLGWCRRDFFVSTRLFTRVVVGGALR